jgi:uncharacterized membrane protein
MAHCLELRRQLFIRRDHLVNHHYLLKFTHEATSGLIWWNFAHLFMVSLVPATTAWMAATKLAAAPVCVYALVFVLVEAAFIAFERAALSQASDSDITPRLRRITRIRSYLALGMFSAATAVSSERARSGLLCPAHLPKPSRT